jgi:glycine/D-amino acid oxidase-like deaminating enzyme
VTFGDPWWIEEAGLGPACRPLAGDVRADVVVVGGGLTGLWTALALRERDPDLDIALVEADFCGSGPSGRNGGFLHGWWSGLGRLLTVFGSGDALALARASDRIIPGVRAFLSSRRADAWLRESGMLMVSAAPAQDDAVARAVATTFDLGAGAEALPLSAKEVAEICASPVFRRGVFFRDGATIQPARLVRALRDAAMDAGVRVYERSPARRIHRTSRSPRYRRDGGTFCVVETPGGSVRAVSAVVAAGAWATGWRPVASHVTNMGSWVVLTEPAPDLLREIGWTGGEAICDARMFLHYFRTTEDGRVLMGAGAGALGYRGRVDSRFFADEAVARRATAGLRRLLPAFADVRIEHSWGGPIDVSADRLPFFGTLPGAPIHYGLGYTGNGVGPTWLGGQVLASLALGRNDEWTRLPIACRRPRRLPPEPLRRAGGVAIRAATLACEDAYEAGRPAPALLEGIAAIPSLLGLPLGIR